MLAHDPLGEQHMHHMKYFKLIRGAKSQGRPDIHNPGGPELSWLCALVLTDIMSLYCARRYPIRLFTLLHMRRPLRQLQLVPVLQLHNNRHSQHTTSNQACSPANST